MKFGDRLRCLRQENDLTQEELGRRINKKKANISKYENGKLQPDLDTINVLAKFFNVTTDYLLGYTDFRGLGLVDLLDNENLIDKPKDGRISEMQRSAIITALSADFGNLEDLPPDKQRRIIKTFIKKLEQISNNEIVIHYRSDSEIEVQKEKGIEIKTSVPILGTIKAGIPILSEENYEGELEIPSDMSGDFAVEVSGDSMVGAGINPGDYILCKQSQTAYNKDIVAAVRHGEVTLKYFIENNGKPVLRAANPEYEDIPIDEYTRIEGVKTGLIRKESTPYHWYQQYISTRDNNLQEWDEVIEKAAAYGIQPDKVKTILDMHWEMISKK